MNQVKSNTEITIDIADVKFFGMSYLWNSNKENDFTDLENSNIIEESFLERKIMIIRKTTKMKKKKIMKKKMIMKKRR